MSECGASLSELRQAENLSADVRYRGSLITKRCDCKNSNGLDPMCKCTKPPPTKSRVIRSVASVQVAPPPRRRIFTQTTPAPTPNFKSNAPELGINLNGDTIPIPARYKYRKQFLPVPDPKNQLHWMVRPETPPRIVRNPKNYHKFEEPVPHHRRNHMMHSTEENVVRPHLAPESVQPQQQFQAHDADNFHGPEPKAGNFQAEPPVSAVNPSQELGPKEGNYMYKPNRGYNYDQLNELNRAAPPQEQAPVSHPTPEPVSQSVQENCAVQAQAPSSQTVQEAQKPHPCHAPVAATQCIQEPLQPSHPNPETIPATASVAASVSKPTDVQQRESAPMTVNDRPATPIPARDTFAQDLEAARAKEGVATHNTAAMSHVPLAQAAPRDLPPCPDRFYPCSHC